MKYVNFDLALFGYQKKEAGDEKFRVCVLNCPQGQMRLDEAEEVRLGWGDRMAIYKLKSRSLELPEIIQRGEILGNLLFPPRVRELYDKCRTSLPDKKGLRIRLRLESLNLDDLPWEFAYIATRDTPPNQKGPDGFLVLDRKISLVRFEIMGKPMVSLDPVGPGRLRMAILMADPDDPDLGKLNLKEEREELEKLLKKIPVIHPQFYPKTTLEKLEDALRGDLHAFHFAGHGGFEGDLGVPFDGQEGKGFILLEDQDQRSFKFPAERLALNLAGRGVRLAVLGSCESGRRDQVNPWTGVSPALTHAGIPAVVGMQFKILDKNAIAFSREFYKALAEGESIDAAVTGGRLAILNRGEKEQRDWGVPVLYLRAEEGVLFPMDVVTAANVGIRTLIEIPEAYEIVCRSKETIKKTCDQANKLEFYKTIHDALHKIESQCLLPLRGEGSAANLLGPYKFSYDKLYRQIDKVIEGHKMTPEFEELHYQLELVSKAFQNAVDAPDEKALKNVMSELEMLLSGFPSDLDKKMTDAASELDLDRLVDLMAEAKSKVSESDDRLAPLIQGIDALHKLRDELASRVLDHNMLQYLDTKLRTVCLPKTDPKTVAGEWERVKRVRSRIKPPFSEEIEAVNPGLVAVERQIDIALEQRKEQAALSLIGWYFSTVNDAFQEVDSKLKEFCMTKLTLHQSLQAVFGI